MAFPGMIRQLEEFVILDFQRDGCQTKVEKTTLLKVME
jgi:hypothetical protein